MKSVNRASLKALQTSRRCQATSGKNVEKTEVTNPVRSLTTSNRTFASTTTAVQAAFEAPTGTTVPKVDTTPNPSSQYYQSVDGAYACAYVAYGMSDTSFIYPITPSSVLGELADTWMAQGKKNCFGQVVEVREMQSEAGAAGAMHGALVVGSMCTSFTASQGLLLMIPNLYKMVGELLPCVLHVAAREIAGQALSIFGSHNDIMAVRQTGAAILSGHSVQQAHDMALISHISTLKTSIPFVHFFDGFRTSHEVNKIQLLPYSEMAKMIPWDAVHLHWSRALNPTHPTLRGTNQGPDIFFQAQERANPFYVELPEVVQASMDLFAKHTGRQYKLFDYYGDANATDVIVIMGSAYLTAVEGVDYLMKQGKKVGVVGCHLFRPWSKKHFMQALPKTAVRIAVLDRSKEVTALGEALYLDVVGTMHAEKNSALIVGGRYGLGSKDFTPELSLATFANLLTPTPKTNFTLGIKDDMSNTHLPYWEIPVVDTVAEGTKQCIFWGLGSDGTVGANRAAVKIIGDKTDLMAQAYFSFDAFKSGGVTSSHLRFGPKPITSQYLITNADYVACHFTEYVKKFRMADRLRVGGAFVLNCRYSPEELDHELPSQIKRKLYEKKAKFYTIDARKICNNAGLGKRINMVMQAAFFKLSEVIPIKEAVHHLKESVVEEYGKKGAKIIEMNQSVIDIVVDGDALTLVPIPESWKDCKEDAPAALVGNDFVDHVMKPMMLMQGEDLPVSRMVPGGTFPVAITQYAKRAIAASVPMWIPNNCTQCNYCAFTCPHAVIRPFVLTDQEAEKAPKTFETRKAKGDFAGMNYRITIAPLDCTGCEICVHCCPDNALVMIDAQESLDKGENDNWDFATTLPEYGYMTDKFSVKGSQFQRPLLEFSGACEGCGETPYVKLMTQLFGERAIIANATGCSSIWGGTASFTPYSKNSKGNGPAWGNSLFEDNAEYGFGMAVANAQRRNTLANLATQAVEQKLGDANLQKLLGQWLRDRMNSDKTQKYMDQLVVALRQHKDVQLIGQLYDMRDMLPNICQWIIGGDGWANDIGYGGLDHVLASGQNVNVIVLDTEMYSNTGGQMSKASQTSAVAKFALGGKNTMKKNMGEMAMAYGNVYVASISLGNMAHCVKAMTEAESYDGPSLLLAYAPCIEHGIRAGMSKMVQESEAAIDCGYWSLYRYDPRLIDQGKSPFQLDSKRIKGDVMEFLKKENRFINLEKNNPKMVDALRLQLTSNLQKDFARYKRYEAGTVAVKAKAAEGPQVTILYGSETGNSANLAKELASDFERRDYAVSVQALDDIDPAELPEMGFVVILASTCGQGAFPKNCQLFWQELQKPKAEGYLKNLKYCVFGLGDTSYYFYCHTAKLIDARMAELGATRVVETGFGDDGDEDKFETGFSNWIPSVWTKLGTKVPEAKLFQPSLTVKFTPEAQGDDFHFSHSQPVMSKTGAVRITPTDYNRNFVTIEWKTEMPYRIGDSLGIYPANDAAAVAKFLKFYGCDPKAVVSIENRSTRELPETVSLDILFSRVLDVFGKPNRRFYQNLVHFATDAKEKERLQAMGSGSGEYSKVLAETLHYGDVLEMFKSAKPPLHFLIEMIPNIKPRFYSISSSPKDTPGEVHSLVLIDTWTTPAGKPRTGLTCSMLQNVKAGQYVDGCIHPTAMEFPDSDERPMVMAGIGSGLAPFIAFMRERSWKRKQGMKVGNNALYFGNRYEKKEYLMEKELKGYAAEGLCHVRTAFSRDDPKKKVYVQDIVKMDPELLFDLLVKQKGSMYVCGSREMPKPVQASLKHCFMTGGKMTEKEADAYIIEMFTTGRYNIESW